MKTLSISTAWNEAAAFVGRESALLFPVGFALIALPSFFFQVATPEVPPGQQPEGGPWMLLAVPLLVFTLLGTLTLATLTLRPGITVGEAIASAGRRLPAMLGASLLMGLAAAILILPALTAIRAGGAAAVLIGPVAAALFVLVSIRLSLLNPIGAVEPLGSIALLRRSWALTRGHFSKLAGFFAVFIVVTLVLIFAVSAVGGVLVYLVSGSTQASGPVGLAVLLLGAMLNTVVTVYFSVTGARIYAQLA